MALPTLAVKTGSGADATINTLPSAPQTTANSVAVALSSDHSNVPVTFSMPALVAGSAVIGKVAIDQTTDGTTNLVAAKQNGTWNVTNISGTISLPTGAATSAKQDTLAALFPTSIGQKAASGSLAVALPTDQIGALAPVVSTALEASRVLKASPGSLFSISIAIGVTSGWLLLFDATTAPADGAVTPKYAIPVGSNGTNGFASINFDTFRPLSFTTGIVAVFSSTGPFTKTASATAFFSGQVN